ncbi:hypothetical protein [Actinocorallia populi]|uniref:hypothetical protein n=1 Tax=Actinocorallia populi TaxID=2079200 RepID=UPI000D086EA1|nr:hypothetical protein [Actinocorallia populi]
MANDSMPDAGLRPTYVRYAKLWLRQHGLGDGPPTPLLTARLAVRWRARTLDSVLQAVLIIGAALVLVSGGLGSRRPAPVLALGALIAALVLARTLLDAWIRRVDRQVGAALARRAAHAVQPGWRALLGWPYAALVAGTFAGAFALGAGALAVGEDTARYAAVVVLVAVVGVGLGEALQLRELLARPVVAEDEVSLMADVIMRIEDVREGTTPTVLWTLPMVLLVGFSPGWLNAACFGFVVLGAAAYIAVRFRMPGAAAVAREVVGAR